MSRQRSSALARRLSRVVDRPRRPQGSPDVVDADASTTAPPADDLDDVTESAPAAAPPATESDDDEVPADSGIVAIVGFFIVGIIGVIFAARAARRARGT